MSVAPAVSVISRPETADIPYLTPQEYQAAGTGVNIGNLIPGGSLEQQAAGLQDVILQASSWMDGECHQVLGATTDTELAPARMDRDGTIWGFPRCFPIRQITAVSVGWQPVPAAMQALSDLSAVVPFNRSFAVYQSPLPISWAGAPLQFGPTFGPNRELWLQYSYVNGYPVTTLGGNCASGATQITVVNATGIVPGASGMTLTLYDPPNTETVIAQSVSGNVVTLVAGTISAHNEGVPCRNLPPAVTRAAILATSGYIRQRGSGGLVMNSTKSAATTQTFAEAGGQGNLDQARAILAEGQYIAEVGVKAAL